VSLLLDALKKAERAKAQAAGEPVPQETKPLELEPLQPPAEAASPPLPELPAEMGTLDAQFIDQAPATKSRAEPPRRPAGEPRGNIPKPPPVLRAEPAAAFQAQAQNVFAAKEPPPAVNKMFAITVGAGTLVAVIGIGTYFWLQLQPHGGLGLAPAAPLAASARPAAPPAPLPPSPPAAALPTAQASTQPPAPAPEAKEQPVGAVAAEPGPAAARATRPEPESPIRVTHGTLKLNPDLASGFEAFGRGDLPAAAADYQRVLDADPDNADALHGLAAIALRQGRPGEADGYYRRAIQADPLDAVAQSELAGLHSQGDPVAEEGRLKSLIAGQPDQPSLQFALGNVYARQARWAEAQQAYFKAYTGDPENPDYLFDLAVALDQLHQDRLAAQYYGQALAAAARRPASFDARQAENRLRELKP
jgi:tetratricopeptide (TPR) repeat protein